MSLETVDAVVIGAGPNGLVACNALADAGWDVVLVESATEVGGAVKTAEVTAPGFRNDMFSAFYPLAAGSPVIQNLDLGAHGLSWRRAPLVLDHPYPDGRSAALSTDVTVTAASVEEFAPGDGESWSRMYEAWCRIRDPLMDALFTPFPPVRSAVRLLARLRVAGALDLARLSVLPVRRLGDENFRGEGGKLLLAGNAMHSDVPPDGAGSGVFGWLLAMLGQDVGFPVPEGGAQNLAYALERRFAAAGGSVRTGTTVEAVLVENGRASGVRTSGGDVIRARKGVLADVVAPHLYRHLVGAEHVPARLLRELDNFQLDNPTLKINWALSSGVPWTAEPARRAGTVHVGADLDGLSDFATDLTVGRVPQRPFSLFGQMTTSDPSRSPEGTESAWAYTHVSRRTTWDDAAVAAHAERVEETVEAYAPGFRDRILARQVQSPSDLQRANANLVDGAVNQGTSNPHQQLFLRPTPGTGRPETPIPGLYLAGASAHPGGGVHGACGWNAARSALGDAGPTGALRRALLRTAWARILSNDPRQQVVQG